MLCSILQWMPTPECASEVGLDKNDQRFETRGRVFCFFLGKSINLPVPKCTKVRGRFHSTVFFHPMGLRRLSTVVDSALNRLPFARNLYAVFLGQKLSKLLCLKMRHSPKSNGCSSLPHQNATYL